MRPLSEIEKILGARLRERRVMEGRSQEWIALELDLSLQMVSKYELGEKRLPITDAIRICKLLGWTMEELLLDLADLDPVNARAPLSADAIRIAIDLDDLCSKDPQKIIMGTVTSIIRGAKAVRASA